MFTLLAFTGDPKRNVLTFAVIIVENKRAIKTDVSTSNKRPGFKSPYHSMGLYLDYSLDLI